ncbi:hypothetical protein [Nocardioides convexus]|nr:hypothetical protein [Nocardioides convexus]
MSDLDPLTDRDFQARAVDPLRACTTAASTASTPTPSGTRCSS